MKEIKVFDIGEDGESWLVVNTSDEDAARVGVIRLLLGQLIPGDEETFADCVAFAASAPAETTEYPVLADPESERVCTESPVGRGAPRSYDFLGIGGVAIGFSLPSHRDLESADSRAEA